MSSVDQYFILSYFLKQCSSTTFQQTLKGHLTNDRNRIPKDQFQTRSTKIIQKQNTWGEVIMIHQIRLDSCYLRNQALNYYTSISLVTPGSTTNVGSTRPAPLTILLLPFNRVTVITLILHNIDGSYPNRKQEHKYNPPIFIYQSGFGGGVMDQNAAKANGNKLV